MSFDQYRFVYDKIRGIAKAKKGNGFSSHRQHGEIQPDLIAEGRPGGILALRE